jgi:hypothetical protein
VSYDPQLQIVNRPGGLSPSAHVLNVIAALISCGFWLPFYVIIWLSAPMKRVDVVAPAGTPLNVIEAARMQALQLTPGELAVVKNRRRAILVIFLGVPALLVALIVAGNVFH